MEQQIITADGKKVTAGDRVFNYYDGFWVIIAEPAMDDGWFRTRKEDGTRGPLLNGERIAAGKPTWW